MADTAPTLPLFFRELEALDAAKHAALRLDRGRDYRFARETNAVPVAIREIAAAACEYPIVFGGPGQPTMLAILGYRDRENLYVDGTGLWRRGCYVPAYARNYPFAIMEAPQTKTLMLAADTKATALGAEAGTPLFADGKPTPALNEAAELTRQLHQALRETAAFCTALEAQNLLVPHSAVIEFKQGGSATLGGFRVIDAQKFDALPDALFLDWRKRGWLAPIYGHFHAGARWGRIVDLAAGARA